jgi:hypothetical protein
MKAVPDKTIETRRRQRFLQKVNRAFAALRKNAKAWKAEGEERKAWDIALADGSKPKP